MQRFRKVTLNKIARLKESLEEADWTEVNSSHDTNTAYDKFMTICMSHSDRHIPLVNKCSNYKKSPRLPWITKPILRLINRKNNLYYASKIQRSEKSHRKYSTYKNILTKILRIEKRKYLKKSVDSIQT